MTRYVSLVVCVLLLVIGGCVSGKKVAPQDAVPVARAAHGSSASNPEYPLCVDSDDETLREEAAAGEEDPVEVIEDDSKQVFEPDNLSQEERQVLHAGFSFPVGIDIDANEDVQSYFALFVHKKRCTMQNWLKRAQLYMPYAHRRFHEEGLPEELIYLPFGESGYNPFATSSAGAAGIWQFMPATGRTYGLRVDDYVDERRDPYKSTEAAIKYLKYLYGYFQDWPLALAAYNAGEGTVGRALKQTGCSNYFGLVQQGECLPSETKRYVPKFLALGVICKNLDALKFNRINVDAPPRETAWLAVSPRTDLEGLARSMGMDWLTFRDFNPALRKKMSAPNRKMKIAVPVGKLAMARDFLASPASIVPMYAQYKVQSGDSLWKVAKSVGLSITELKRINHMSAAGLRVGQVLRVPYRAGAGKAVAGKTVTTETAAAPLASSRVCSMTHTVRSGETLWGIAGKYGVPVADLKKANRTDSLKVGQVLSIPGTGVRPSQKAKSSSGKAGATYVVQQGDTVWSIARKFDTDSATLLRHNNMSGKQTLRVGQKLWVSDSGIRPATSSANRSVAYKVCQGDSLWTIAKRFGVTTSDLMQWNRLPTTQQLRPGDVLQVQTK